MKNAILVSSDARWRVVAEGTLLARGWSVACSETLGVQEALTPDQVQAIVLDAGSLGADAVAGWLKSQTFTSGIPVILSPGFQSAETLSDFLDDPLPPISDLDEEPRVKIRFWGVRGSIPTPGPNTSFYGGNTSCVELQADGETMILDAGSGLRALGDNLIKEAAGAPLSIHLLITHTHWDHIQGFPFFRPAYQPSNRLRVIGYSGVRHDLEDVLSGQMDCTYFPISMSDMMAEIDVLQVGEVFHCGPVKGHAFYTNHPGKCAGFRFDTSAGAVVYVPDNEMNQSGQATHMPRETAKHLRERFVETVAGARVLIHDAQYTRAEYVDRVGWGHSCLEDVVEMAGEAGVEKLYFFHHDPTRTDAGVNQLIQVARKIVADKGWSMKVEAAREGLEIVL
ncbi:MAG: MBL fold metallo-hydrolase [Verrucomicrobiota bacterium]